jgi:hypothetical protein
VALLYAHWEGFIKSASRAYLEFVSLQRLKHRELAPNFLALSAGKLFRLAGQADRHRMHVEVTKFF